MKKIRQNKAFTLVEIMIVVLIIGILMAIAVPNFIQARKSSRLNTVLANLKQIEGAKEQCAMDQGAASGDSSKCTSSTLVPTYMKAWPTNTPVTGTYAEGAIGTNPTFNGKDAAAWTADPSGL